MLVPAIPCFCLTVRPIRPELPLMDHPGLKGACGRERCYWTVSAGRKVSKRPPYIHANYPFRHFSPRGRFAVSILTE